MEFRGCLPLEHDPPDCHEPTVSGQARREATPSAGRTVALRCRVASKHGSDQDTLHLLQATAPTVSAIDASAMLSSPPLDHLLGVVPGEITLGHDPPNNLTDALFGFPAECPTARLPIGAE